MSSSMKTRKPEPAEIAHKNMRFLITDRPTDATIDKYIEELRKHNAKDVVRVCDPTYKTDRLEEEGVQILDWAFDDGSPPPDDIISGWFDLLRRRFREEPG